MATQRPGFQRHTTDIHNDEEGHSTSYDPEKHTGSPEIVYMDEEPEFIAAKEDHFGETAVLSDAKDVLTHVIHVDDDPTLSPWTFRAFFLGMYR
jgi:hypothetical protein